MSVLDFALGAAGMPDNEISELKAALPTLSLIADEAAELEPILQQAMPHLVALKPMLIQAAPILQKMWPQVVAVTPLLKEMIAFIESKN